MSARLTLLRIIKHFQLDFRFAKWRETMFLIKQGIYTDAFCEILIPEAEDDAEKVEKLGNFLWKPPEQDDLYAEGKPDIELGTSIESGCRVGIRYKDRPRNILIYGSGGSGKTVTTRRFMLGVDAENIKHPDNPTQLIITDIKPDNLDLAQKLQGNVLLLSLTDNLRIGLNGPANVPPYVWIGHISMSLAGRLGLAVSRTCLAGIITRLLIGLNPGLRKADLADPTVMKDLIWPPLSMVLDALRIKKILDLYSSKAGYGQTLIQMLSGLLLDSGSLFDCCNGLDVVKEIFDKKQHCLINASNTPSYIVHLVNDRVINYVHMSRAFNNYKCDHTDAVYIYDESDILTESDWEDAFQDSLSPLNRLNRLGRESGLMSVVSISAPQAASKHIRRSAHYTIGFNLSDSESIRAAIHDLQLDPRCSRMLSSLPPSQCIFRQTQASWSNAFWCEMDFVPPARMLGRPVYAPHQHVKAIKLVDVPEILTDLNALVEEAEKTQERQNAIQNKCRQEAMKLLKLAIERLNTPVARLMQMLGGIPPKTQMAIRSVLEEEGYAKFEEPRVGRRNMLLVEATEKGYTALGVPMPQGKMGRGGITHRYFTHLIKAHFEQQGYQAIIEWLVPGTNHPVDIAVDRDSHWHVFEICVTSPDNVVSHIRACFEDSTAVSSLTVITGTKLEARQLQASVLNQLNMAPYIENIRFESIEKYIPREAQP